MHIYDLIIVGAGPAGLSAAMQAKQRSLSCLVLESGSKIASTIREFSVGKWVMAEPDAMSLRAALPFAANSREALLHHWQAAADDIDIHFNRRLAQVSGRKGNFLLNTDCGAVYQTKHIVLAYGTRQPRTLVTDGADTATVHYQMPANPFKQQRILLVGAGDSALEEALLLCRDNEVTLLNRGVGFPKAKLANQKDFARAVAQKKIRCFERAQLRQLNQDTDRTVAVIEAAGNIFKLDIDQVLARIGYLSPRPQLEKFKLKFASANASFPLLDEHHQSTVDGLYVIGALAGEALIKPGINQGFDVVEHILGRPAESLQLALVRKTLTALGSDLSPDALKQGLAEHKLFKLLSPRSRLRLLEKANIQSFSPKQQLLSEGDYVNSLHLLISGDACVGSSQQPLATLSVGSIFGEFSLLSHKPASQTVVANTKGLLLSFSRASLVSAWAESPAFLRALLNVYLRRLVSTELAPKLPTNLLTLLLARATVDKLSAQKPLFSEAGEAVFLVTGAAQQTDTSKTQLWAAGNFIGLLEALENKPTPSALALQDNTLVLRLDRELLQVLRKADSNLPTRARAMVDQRPAPRLSREAVKFYHHENLSNATDVLVINKDTCVGCDNCETACAATHGGISRVNRKSGNVFANLHLPGSCRHCEQALCMTDCPADALVRAPDGSVQITDKCIGCGNCVTNCPYNAISLPEEKSAKPKWLDTVQFWRSEPSNNRQALKCDGCQGRSDGPACVSACPTGAAQRLAPSQLIEVIQLP